MTFKTAFYLLFFVFSFVTSCRTPRQAVQKSDSQKETVKEYRVTYKDTIIYAPTSETNLKVPFKPGLNGIVKPQTFSQKNGNATVKVRIQRDTIYVTAKCDSLAIASKIKQEYLSESDKIKESSQETLNKGISLFKSILYSLSALIIGLGLGVIITKFKLI